MTFDPTRALMRFLLWLLGVAMVANYVLAWVAFGDAPGYLLWGGVPLLGWLTFTNPTVRRWFS